jgi:acyl-homoserine-lactone acylase
VSVRDRRAVLATGLGILLVASLLAILSAPLTTTPESRYYAVIRRTSYGIPHIWAADLGSAGFGQGWAYAEDRFCDLADQVVRVRSERSKWFGPGPEDANLISDFGYISLGIMARAREQLPRMAPDMRTILDGYAAGYNAYLAEVGVDGVPGWCAGQPWVGAITTVDLLAYQRDSALFASGSSLLDAIVAAQPPDAQGEPPSFAPAHAPSRAALAETEGDTTEGAAVGSNGWAIGSDRTAGGHGLVVANPHFPWEGELRFWESQLTVPGQLNVYGASLGGLPGVQIGFNEHVAWTHTVAQGSRFTFYTVRLVPGQPTAYLVDGKPEAMTSTRATIQVKGPDGRLSTLTRTLWSTRYGPVLDLSQTDPGLGWSTAQALTYRDANIDNDRLLDQWLGMNRARSMAEFQQVHAQVQGIPWLNTIAADDRGTAWYADTSATPNLSAEAIDVWVRSPLGILDGSDSRFAWVVEPGARSPGLIPFSQQPQLERRDYVFNANNSHWLANPERLLTGFSPLQGQEGVPPGPRARENAVLLGDVSEDGPAGGDGRFTLDEAGAAMLSDRALTADLLVDGVVAACRAQDVTPIDLGGKQVDVSGACQVLAGWDWRFDVDSRGAVIWREMIRTVAAADQDALLDAGPLFQVGFDPSDPVGTPHTLAEDTGPVLRALAQAVINLRAAGIDLDVPLGQVQFTKKGAERIPVPGSSGQVGIANVVDYAPAFGTSLEPPMPAGTPIPNSDLTSEGYLVNFGTSFFMTAEFTEQGPVARALLTYSQSADPDSPHFADQTRRFTRKALRDCLFTEHAIGADPNLSVTRVRGS